MTKSTKNPILAFFSSVQLALFLLFVLAATSIIGTIIPQNSPASFYAKQYGPQMARFFELLKLTDMYNSWWFLLLLLLFAINLIVCSIDRIPQVIRIIKKDNLAISPERLQKMSLSSSFTWHTTIEMSVDRVHAILTNERWKTTQRDNEQGTLFFAEKGPWTRFGVYVVHISILIILLGAVIGSSMIAKKVLHKPSFAFKGSVMIPETRESEVIYSFKSGQPIDLGFTVRCDFFDIEYYSNGMPKTYLSKVTVLENDQEILSTDIEVNAPLTYKGVTFYQSSYQPYQDFVVSLQNNRTNKQIKRVVPPAKQLEWQEGGISFGIINQEAKGKVTQRVKVWLTDNQGDPSTFWVNMGQEAMIERPSGTYTFNAKQLYATGLQVTKDPGVWLVYWGCILMLVGLYIAFFMSHRKLFVFIQQKGKNTEIIVAGNTNKNKIGFEKTFNRLATRFEATDE
ncbi:cytochrome c biogenesis protein ResB [Desulfogranum marinum]|uniref:cytochrome c biogenesis protein ResB n=1 Tax=Desulfogranum marinum TaxID=453220 RepID=UPI0019654B9D|nr:cytochrome c biogenesis protein ResB [Desulfogranum marinum]MBM9513538.1 cytochrome c biogenesis protein ResB [Desulfogranum marinum]